MSTQHEKLKKNAQLKSVQTVNAQQQQKEVTVNISQGYQTFTDELSEFASEYQPLELKLENPEEYRTQAIQRQDIAHVTQGAPVVDEAFETQLNALTYNDFRAMIGTHNRGQVELADGKLQIINNHKFSSSKGKASAHNRSLRERFLCLALEKLQDQRTDELYERFIRTLKLDQNETEALPLTRKEIHDVLADINMRTSTVSKTLFLGSKADPLQLKIAQAADSLVAGNVSAYERSHTTPETEKMFRSEINNILEIARRTDKKIPSLSQHQMDNLVKGNMELVREEIYHSLHRAYQYMVNVSYGEEQNTKDLLNTNGKAANCIAAYTILKLAAVSEEGKSLAEYQLKSYLAELAFRFGTNLNADKAYDAYTKMDVGALSTGGAQGLAEAVEARKEKNKKLQAADQSEKLQRGLTEMTTLCNTMQQLSALRMKGLEEGLSAEEVKTLKKAATAIQAIAEREKANASGQTDLEFVASQLKGTRFAEGYKQFRSLTKSFSYRDVSRYFAASVQQKTQAEKKTYVQEIDAEQLATDKGIVYQLDMLEGHARQVASVMFLKSSPSEFLKKKEDPLVGDYQKLYNQMKTFHAGGAQKVQLNIGGVSLVLEQKESRMVDLVIDDVRLTLPVTAGLIVDALETDMVQHEDLYGRENLREIIAKLKPISEDPVEWTRSRMLCLKYLQAKMGKRSDYFNNTPTNVVREFATYLLSGDMTKDDVINLVSFSDKIENNALINGAETLELLAMAEAQAVKEQELERLNVILPEPQVKTAVEGQDWTDEETMIRDLVADMVFSTDTWTADRLLEEPGVRLQKMLERHIDTLVLLARQPELLDGMLDKLALPGAEELQKSIHESIMQIIDSVAFDIVTENVSDEELAQLFLTGIQSNLIRDLLADAEIDFNREMNRNIDELQQSISAATDDLFQDKADAVEEAPKEMDPKLKKALKGNKELKAQYEFKQSVDELNQMMKEAASGSRGQGKFMKLVLDNYFSQVSDIDQRTMLASAIRNAKPKPQLPEDATDEERKRAERQQKGAYLGGFLKGAGPLMHKMLQGLPTEALPEELQGALKDMKSNLAPIPEEIVKAQMNAMVERSRGQVTQIEILRALGAASVGQAFLCKLYGPNLPETGKDVVIKLLRPDVRNRMEREKQIMLDCAEKTDSNHGMYDTYMGQLSRITEELDLTLEAKNVQEGKVYDKDWATVKSMKLNSLIEPTANSMVLERAPGTTVDKYLDDVRKTTKQLAEFYSYNDRGEPELLNVNRPGVGKIPKLKLTRDTVNQYVKLRAKIALQLEQLKKRQVYMTQLAQSWVTEGVFGEGFYHGDLHAGNIMIDDDGLTVIDFGNATKLTKEQQTEVTRMVAAAAFGDMKAFRSGLHHLLEYKDEQEKQEKEAYYQSKREELGEEIEKIFSLGNHQYAGQRIAVALLKAQELGIQVPPAIFNFSQCQIRLQNALDEMNNMITTLQKGMATIHNLDDQFVNLITYNTEQAESNKLASGNDVSASETFKYIMNNISKEEFFKDLDTDIRRNTYEKVQKNQAMVLCGYMNRATEIEKLFDQVKRGEKTDAGEISRTLKIKLGDLRPFFEDDGLYDALEFDFIDCLSKPQESEERFRDLMELLHTKLGRDKDLRDAFDQTLQEYYTAVREEVGEEEQDVHQRRITELQDRMYQAYQDLNLSYVCDSKAGLLSFRKNLEKRDPEEIQKLERMLQPLLEDKSQNGEQLRAAYQAFRLAQETDAQNFLQTEREFLRIYREIVIHQVDVLDEAKKYQFQWEDQESFFDVMAGVITKNLTASLRRLGVMAMWKYGSQIDAINGQNESYENIEQKLQDAVRKQDKEA